MSEVDLQAYLTQAVAGYAEEHVKAGNWHPAEALHRAQKEFDQLLPAGLASHGQYLFSIVDEQLGAKVGLIWLAVNDTRVPASAFVYDFVIFEPFRRRGYGTQALLAIEGKARELGADTIALHVFGHNRPARALYEKLGYEITNLNLAKKIGKL